MAAAMPAFLGTTAAGLQAKTVALELLAASEAVIAVELQVSLGKVAAVCLQASSKPAVQEEALPVFSEATVLAAALAAVAAPP